MNTPESIVTLNRKTIRSILFILGVIGLVTALVAVIVTPGGKLNTISMIALAVGVLGLGGAILIDPAAVARKLARPAGRFSTTTLFISIAFTALIIAAYILIIKVNPEPLDLSEGSQYTLSEASREILAKNDGDIHAIGFFTDAQNAMKEEAEIWLSQYESASEGHFTYEFVDPDRNPSAAQEMNVTRSGVIILSAGDQKAEVASVTEREITTAFVRVMLGESPVVYALTGHGEYDFTNYENDGYSSIGALMEAANFDVRTLNLVQEGKVPEDAALLLIPGPTTQLTSPEMEAIQTYVAAGGKLLVLSDPGSGGGSLGNGVLSGAFSPDGSQIALASGGGVISLRDRVTGDVMKELHGHTLDVLDLAFSPDGSELASAGADGTIRIWDAATGEETTQLEGQLALVTRVAYSPDGAYLASVGEDESENVNIWETEGYQPIEISPLNASVPLYAVTFSHDGKYLAAGGGRGTDAGGFVYVWDVETGEALISQALHDNVVFNLAFSPDDETLISVSIDGTYSRLDLETKNSEVLDLYPDVGITALLVLEDGTEYLAVGDGSLRMRKEGTETTIGTHADMIWDLQLSPDGSQILSSGRDGYARLWDIASGTMVAEFFPGANTDPLAAYLLDQWGLRLNEDVVIDLDTASQFSSDTPVIFNLNTVSPVTNALEMLTFYPVARSIDAIGENPAIEVMPLLLTSPTPGQSWGETDLRQVEFDELDTEGPVAIAVSAEDSDTGARIIVVGDSDFISNNSLQYTAFGNDKFFLNAVNWLTETEDAIDLPISDVGLRMLDTPFSTVGFGLTAIASTCLLPIGMAVAGLYIFFLRKRRR